MTERGRFKALKRKYVELQMKRRKDEKYRNNKDGEIENEERKGMGKERGRGV